MEPIRRRPVVKHVVTSVPASVEIPYPEHTQRMRDCQLYFDLREGRSLEHFLAKATIKTTFEIDMPFPLYTVSFMEIYRIFTEGYFVFLARKLRFDRSDDGILLSDKLISGRLRFPKPKEVYDELARLGHEKVRMTAGNVYKKLHLLVPTILNLYDQDFRNFQFSVLLEELDRAKARDAQISLQLMHDQNRFWASLPEATRNHWLENNPGLRSKPLALGTHLA